MKPKGSVSLKIVGVPAGLLAAIAGLMAMHTSLYLFVTPITL